MEINGKLISKKYTPISKVNDKGKVEFVIKIYRPNEEFPAGGKFTPSFEKIEPGQRIKMEGPKGLLIYKGFGNFIIKKKPVKKTKIGLIAGGTGITPCF
jgi:ferredoxin-NADP reductase